jgi:hypothetical protein
MHLGQFRNNANEENAQIDNNIKLLVVCGMTSYISEYCGHQYQELLGLSPWSARINLLIQGKGIVFTLCAVIRCALNPMENDESNLMNNSKQ